jgi:hypothetical protein
MTIATQTPAASVPLRFAFRAIFIHQNDEPEDREVWWNASEAEQLQAEREVRAYYDSVRSQRLTRAEALGR